MIFLDREEQVFEREIDNRVCPKCGHNHVVKRDKLTYLRWFILPFVPVKTSASLFCYHCCRESDAINQDLRIPKTQIAAKFIGLFVLISAVIWLWTDSHAKQQEQQRLIAAPKPFDVVFVDESRVAEEATHQPRYQIAQIRDVRDGLVQLSFGKLSYLKQRQLVKSIRLDHLMVTNYFLPEVLSLPLEEFQAWFRNGKALEIHRPKNLSLFGGLVMPLQKPKPFNLKLPSQDVLNGVDYYVLGDLELAYELFSKAAKNDDPWGQINLAEMYEDGEHVGRDLSMALFWYQASAIQGLEDGKVQLTRFCNDHPICENNNKE